MKRRCHNAVCALLHLPSRKSVRPGLYAPAAHGVTLFLTGVETCAENVTPSLRILAYRAPKYMGGMLTWAIPTRTR